MRYKDFADRLKRQQLKHHEFWRSAARLDYQSTEEDLAGYLYEEKLFFLDDNVKVILEQEKPMESAFYKTFAVPCLVGTLYVDLDPPAKSLAEAIEQVESRWQEDVSLNVIDAAIGRHMFLEKIWTQEDTIFIATGS